MNNLHTYLEDCVRFRIEKGLGATIDTAKHVLILGQSLQPDVLERFLLEHNFSQVEIMIYLLSIVLLFEVELSLLNSTSFYQQEMRLLSFEK